jgi:hypothetical protein
MLDNVSPQVQDRALLVMVLINVIYGADGAVCVVENPVAFDSAEP